MGNDEIRDILKSIEDENGRLTPCGVVDAARDPDHPLHPRFEWDNEVAGEQHRYQQARLLIQQVVYRCKRVSHIIEAVAYVRDPEAGDKQQGYRSIEAIATQEELSRDVLIREFKRIGSALGRARDLASVFDMDAEMADFEARLNLAQAKVEQLTLS